uniref:Uncharacterized protein n=1 Tax=Candidatus Methanophaga sp. ANME-1 ERB7 TaxID=2759913 RepID=A0A7G9Z1Z5_9EURY|nr:hypothetical protein FGBIHFOD_00019 [Methanosarcinales archaeon ANME-1 ERB7]
MSNRVKTRTGKEKEKMVDSNTLYTKNKYIFEEMIICRIHANRSPEACSG